MYFNTYVFVNKKLRCCFSPAGLLAGRSFVSIMDRSKRKILHKDKIKAQNATDKIKPVELNGGKTMDKRMFKFRLGLITDKNIPMEKPSQFVTEGKLTRSRLMKEIVLSYLKPTTKSETNCASSTGAKRNTFNISETELGELVQLFPVPKNTVHNIYQGIASKFKDPQLKVSPEYTYLGPHKWLCTFNLKWPEDVTIKFLGSTGQVAHYYASLSVLQYLRNSEILPLHQPKTSIDKESVSQFLPDQMLQSVANNIYKFHNRFLSNNSDSIQIRQLCTSAPSYGRKSMKETVNSAILPKGTDIVMKPRHEGTKIKKMTNTQPLENTEEHDEEIENVSKKFPQPKRTLHNCFTMVAQELKKNTFNVTPQYKYGNLLKTWTCTYHLKWPEEMKVSRTGKRKQEASYRAAASALYWLLKNKKIDPFGQPLIYDKEDILKIRKDTCPALILNVDVENKLNSIYENYCTKLSKYFSKHVNQYLEDKSLVNDGEDVKMENLWPDINNNLFKQKFRGLNVYLAKETVKLPISDFREEIIETVSNNQIVIIKGQPGCGKSTRVPQYLLEGWAKEDGLKGVPCRIVVTQPRRIAAISLAGRVASERNEEIGNIVGYQVRLKSNFNKPTGRILYCTTGILLRHLQSDPSLSDCTHIILDEAHERDVNTDLLMNLLKQLVKSNPNLKLIVMSATIDTGMFQEYFSNAPIVHIPGFTYPVKEHFLNECKKLNLSKTLKMCQGGEPFVVYEDVASVIKFIHRKRPEGAVLCFLPGWEDIAKVRNLLLNCSDMSVLCVHSRLQDSEQKKIFSSPPPGIRKVILATNIAETSITIDDVVYVVDTGIHKEQRLDIEKGIMCIDNHWISQASMAQRKGRAGRVCPGESFHLYPESKYREFDKYSLPEILRTSLTKIVLDSKVYSNNMNAVEFLSQLPCPPERNAVTKAVDELKDLELLAENENLTPLGRTLSDFQLEPKLSKAMVHSVIYKCVTPIVDIVTLYSAETEIFASGLVDKEGIKKSKHEFSGTSDHLAVMRVFEKWLEYVENSDTRMVEKFCSDYNLLDYKLYMLQKLRDIHFEYLEKGLHKILPISDDYSDNDELVKAVLLSGVGTVLQHCNWDIVKGRMKSANVLLTRHNHKASIALESVNSKRAKYVSDFLVYINETRSNIRRTTTIRETSLISSLAVLLFKNNKLQIEKISNTSFSDKVPSSDQVLIKLVGTKIEFICDRVQAEAIKNCKDALQAGVQYYIYQLTSGAEYHDEVNKYWKEILRTLSDILARECV